jgi:hypothetical protein
MSFLPNTVDFVSSDSDYYVSDRLTHALVAPLEALFDDGARLSDNTAGHHEALVVEVRHCNFY